jgi:hypothetical protein
MNRRIRDRFLGFWNSKNTRKSFGVIDPPLFGLSPLHFNKKSESIQAVAPPLRGSGRTIATVVAHREPWGVRKLSAKKNYLLPRKLK